MTINLDPNQKVHVPISFTLMISGVLIALIGLTFHNAGLEVLGGLMGGFVFLGGCSYLILKEMHAKEGNRPDKIRDFALKAL